MNGSTRTYKSLHHALAVGDVYFALEPERWIYEPKEKFTDGIQEYVWAPDFVCAYHGKLICGEVQLEPLTKKRWEAKWKAWNLFFEKEEYVGAAQFQAWRKKSKTIMPSTYVVITGQREESVQTGFHHPHNKQLLVVKDAAELRDWLNIQIARSG
jgi:hypothetical protein